MSKEAAAAAAAAVMLAFFAGVILGQDIKHAQAQTRPSYGPFVMAGGIGEDDLTHVLKFDKDGKVIATCR